MSSPHESPPLPPDLRAIDDALRTSARREARPLGPDFRQSLAARLRQADAAAAAAGPAVVVPVGARPARSALWTFAAAASLAIAMLTATFVLLSARRPVGQLLLGGAAESPLAAGGSLQTTTGRAFAFLDGRAHVALDHDTQVTVKLGNELVLEKGEIWVHVRSQSGPFRVRIAGGGVVDVVGTSFLVRAGKSDSPVETYSGIVRYTPPNASAPLTVAAGSKVFSNGSSFAVTPSPNLEQPEWDEKVNS